MTDASRRQWLFIAVAAATRFAGGILMGTALAVYIGRRGSPLAVSLVSMSYFLGLMLFSPVWGAVADVTGRRRTVLLVTGFGATVAVLPLTVVDGIWGPIGFRALYAAFAAGFAPVVLAIVTTYGGSSDRGRSIGVFNSARSGGFTGGQLTAGVLLGLFAPAELYLVIAGLSLVSTVAVALLADPTPSPDVQPTLSALAREVRTRLLPAVDEREYLRTNGLRWLYVALAVRNMCVLAVMGLMPPYLVSVVGVSEPVMGALLAINHGGQVAFMYAFGVAADAVGRKPLVVAGMGGSGLFALLAAAATLPAAPLVRIAIVGGAFLVLGAAFSAMTTGAIAFVADVAPADRESELMGLRSTAKGVGGVVGPPLIGALATVTSYETAFAAGSVLALGAAVLVAVALVESHPTRGPLRTTPGDD